MNSRRVLKAAQAVREVVGMAILTDLKDPRIQQVTVTYVEVSPDMRYAKVHVSVMGDEARQQLSLRGLQSAAGYLQQKVARRIDTRYTPKIQFVLDKGVKNALEVARILKEVLPDEPADEPADEPNDDESTSDETPANDGAAEETPSEESLNLKGAPENPRDLLDEHTGDEQQTPHNHATDSR